MIGVLFLIVIVTVMVMAMGTLAVSGRGRADTDSRYAAALDLAEAGINSEFRRITQNVDSATPPSGGTWEFGGGTYTVRTTMLDGSTAWDKTSLPFLITSKGVYHGVSRTVSVHAGLFGQGGNYSLFGVKAGVVDTLKGSAITISGNLGTNGQLSFAGSPTIGGSIDFYGPTSGWSGGTPSGYTSNHFEDPVTWPTVESIANQQVSGGLTYLAGHNDNALCASIAGTTLAANKGTITLVGKPGGANYYFTNVNMGGNSTILMDNTLGPITIWCGPSGGTGTFRFQGGTATVRSSVDDTKPVRLYSASSSDVTFQGNASIDCGLYNVNEAGLGKINLGGTPDVYGPIITNYFNLNGTVNLHYVPRMFKPISNGYYGVVSGTWAEIGAR